MKDNDIIILAEKVQGSELPKCVQAMYDRIGNPRNFRVALAAEEQLLSLYCKNQIVYIVKTR